MPYTRGRTIKKNRTPAKTFDSKALRNTLKFELNPNARFENHVRDQLNTPLHYLLTLDVGYNSLVTSSNLPEEKLKELQTSMIELCLEDFKESDKAIFTQERLKKVEKAYQTKSGNVYKIIQAFMNTEGVSTLEEAKLKTACGKDFKADNYNHWDDVHNKYHIIEEIEPKSKVYILRNEVRSLIKVK